MRTVKIATLLAVLGLIIVVVTTYTGMATLEVNNTVIEMPFSYFIVGSISGVLTLLMLASLWKALWSIPEKYQTFLQKKRSQKALNLVIEGVTALGARQPTEALDLSEQALALEPKNPLMLLVNAFAAQKSNQEDKAETLFKQMMKETRLQFLATLGLIERAKQNNKVLETQSLLKKAIQLRHDSTWVLHEILENNIRCIVSGHPLNVKDQKYSKLLDKKKWAHHLALYYAYQAQKDLQLNKTDDAKINLKKSVAEQPDFTWAIINLANIYKAEKSHNKACKILTKALSNRPHPDILSLLASCNNFKTPTETYHHFCGDFLTKDTNDVCLFLSDLAAKAQLWAEAKKWAERALEKRPTPRGIQLLKFAYSELSMSINTEETYPEITSDTTWHCTKCMTPSSDWQIMCDNCESVDCLEY